MSYQPSNPDDKTADATDLAHCSDELLLHLIVQQQEAALATLYDRYVRLVYTIAIRITGDRSVSEEVVQDVFHNIWQTAAGFQAQRGTFVTWLMAITRHRAIDTTRSRRYRARARESTFGEEWMALDDRQTDTTILNQELRATVREALATLPEPQRQAIELAYFGGLTRNEIAIKLGAPLGTIKTRLRLGLLKLQELLQSIHD